MAQFRVDDTIVTNVATPIKWEIPDSLRTEHATHLIVQRHGSEFTLLFFEQETLLFSGTPEEQIEAYKALESMKAKCIAKIVMNVEDTAQGANNLISILEPFIEATGELSMDMPPKSSRRVTINITRRGRAKPEYFAE